MMENVAIFAKIQLHQFPLRFRYTKLTFCARTLEKLRIVTHAGGSSVYYLCLLNDVGWQTNVAKTRVVFLHNARNISL